MRVSGIFLFILIFSATGCNLFNSEPDLSDKLVGTWEQEFLVNAEQDLKVIFNHHFKNIDKYEVAQVYYDLEDNFLGYRYFEEGSYRLEGNNLVKKPAQIFFSENEEVLYPTIEELKAAGVLDVDSNQEEYRTEFTNSNTTVTLFFDCPPNASCVEPPVLNRVLESGSDIF